MVSDEQVTDDRWISRRRTGTGGSRSSGATPISGWKFYNGDSGGGVRAAVSARKLAASLWELTSTTNCGGGMRWQCGLSDQLGFEFCSSSTTPKSAMEGVKKWDYGSSKASDDVNHFLSHVKLLDYQETATTSVAAARQAKLYKAEKCIKTQPGWLRMRPKLSRPSPASPFDTKLASKHTECIMKLGYDQQLGQKGYCTTVKDLKDEVRKERRKCKKMYIENSKLVSEIAEAKSLARKLKHRYEKEHKAREMLEDVCNEQAKEIEAKKAEIMGLRNQCARIRREVEDERKMLRIAEAWREERAQMKLVDAKMILEDKYCQMNNTIAEVKAFLRSSNFAIDGLVGEISGGEESVARAEMDLNGSLDESDDLSNKISRNERVYPNGNEEWNDVFHHESEKGNSSSEICSKALKQLRKGLSVFKVWRTLLKRRRCV